MTPSEWPSGIDLVGGYWHWALRVLAKSDKAAIERLTAESPDLDWYEEATATYLAERERSYPGHPGRNALRRLARLYIRHYRRELIRQHQFLEMAARHALTGAVG